MYIVVASNNQNKIKEIKLYYPNIEFKSLKDLNIADDILEDGKTFKENALKKALYIAKKYNVVTLADDSGLCVLSLNKAPGVLSARYASDHDDLANNIKLVDNLKDKKNKKAYFECAIAIAYPNGKTYIKSKKVYGKILLKPRGNNGFGYDPYFYLPRYKKTMAELSIEEKNQISHRSKALKSVKKIIKKIERC